MRRPGILRHSILLDVAARAGVSRATASRAFNNYPQVHPDLRRRVLKAIKPIERPWIS
jgi:DNA-binding LacI/PurR family transcriptional regulator